MFFENTTLKMKRKASSSARKPSTKGAIEGSASAPGSSRGASSSSSKDTHLAQHTSPGAAPSAGTFSLTDADHSKRVRLIEEAGLSVTLSSHDKAPEVSLSVDRLTCWGAVDCGYSMARATHAVDNGKYYWECEVLNPEEDLVVSPDVDRSASSNYHRVAGANQGGGSTSHNNEGAHARIGWALDSAALAAPVGYDKYGYGYRDINGSKIHNSLREDDYGEAFGPGDVIGCFISLDRADPRGNEIRFVKNGVDQGTAYRGPSIVAGMYFPAVSVYHNARLRVNFGPLFIYPLNTLTHADAAGAHLFQGTLPLSELQPMNADLKKVHVDYVVERRSYYREKAASAQRK